MESERKDRFTMHDVYNLMSSDRYKTAGIWHIQRIKIAKPTEFIYNTRPDWWT